MNYYGEKTPLISLASITVPSADTLVVSPFDKSSIEEISNAILTSNLDVSASVQGEVVRVKVPDLTAVRGLVASTAHCLKCWLVIYVLCILKRPLQSIDLWVLDVYQCFAGTNCGMRERVFMCVRWLYPLVDLVTS